MKLFADPAPKALPPYTLCRACFEAFAGKPGTPGYREWAIAHRCAPAKLEVEARTHEALAAALAGWAAPAAGC